MGAYKGYIGTYTKGESKGIYSFNLDATTGLISNINLATEALNPTYLTIDNENNKLYSVIKLDDENNNSCGGVASFSINSDSTLSYLNSSVTPGKPPCYVSLDTINNNLFSSNYHEKNIISYKLKETGEINNTSCEIIHKGNSHVHFAGLTPDKKYLCSIDLGLDKIFLYNYNKEVLHDCLTLEVKQGCGPRHIAFHPNGKFAYIICELSSEIITLSYDANLGFKIINYISTIPEDFTGINSTAAIAISSDGKFLFGSNRGHNSIVVYSICEHTSALTLIDMYETYGNGPRDFTLTPNENFIVICNEITNNLTVYKRDIINGTLELAYKNIKVPTPVCIVFI